MKQCDKLYGVDRGFSLIELVIAVAIVSLVSSLAMSFYSGYTSDAKVGRAISEIRTIDFLITDYKRDRRKNPPSLATIGVDYPDPWGNPYKYLDIEGGGVKTRKDKNLTPINSDYDLYSMGADGKSALPLTASFSKDDIVRANNGAYLGLAEGY